VTGTPINIVKKLKIKISDVVIIDEFIIDEFIIPTDYEK